jgi:hypothetical protein
MDMNRYNAHWLAIFSRGGLTAHSLFARLIVLAALLPFVAVAGADRNPDTLLTQAIVAGGAAVIAVRAIRAGGAITLTVPGSAVGADCIPESAAFE